MSGLKNCPFCNCEMEIVAVGRDWWRIKPVDMHSDDCVFETYNEFDCSQGNQKWKDEHIEAWNTRHSEDKLTELLTDMHKARLTESTSYPNSPLETHVLEMLGLEQRN